MERWLSFYLASTTIKDIKFFDFFQVLKAIDELEKGSKGQVELLLE